MSPFVRYSLLRLVLLAAVLAVLLAAGARGWLLVVLAVVISGGLAYLLLGRQRAELVERMADRAAQRTAPGADRGTGSTARPSRPGGRRPSRAEADAAAEDADDGTDGS